MKSLTKGRYHWPESIDFDRSGNLYFTDHIQKALFRLKRNRDDSLAPVGERLLYGVEHAGGISIDKEKHLLYLGARVKREGKILRIPLELFDEHTDIQYSAFQGTALTKHPCRPQELELSPGSTRAKSPKPNGVVFDPGTGITFYTHTDLERSFLGVKGFVGSTKSLDLERKKLCTPNGIDMDPAGRNILVFSLFWSRRIIRLDWTSGQQTTSPAFGWGLDGLLCLENGDVLVASYLGGKIFHLRWDGEGYRDPTVVRAGLSSPTDVAIGPSSGGSGESLFVTTTKGLIRSPSGGGDIVEILNFRELLR